MMKSNKFEQYGFSLLELLIVVAVMGILASIAYPQYDHYVKRAARADAMVLLLDAANRQEQYYVDNRTYTDSLNDLGVSASSENGYFAITVDVPDDGLSFMITATAASGPVLGDTECTTYTITDIGIKSSTGTASADKCWER